MLLTEDEAKTKTCRVATSGVFTGKCLGSTCMHWRWGEPLMEISKGSPDRATPAGEGWELTPATAQMDPPFRRWRRVKAQRGYCGLAGPPGRGT